MKSLLRIITTIVTMIIDAFKTSLIEVVGREILALAQCFSSMLYCAAISYLGWSFFSWLTPYFIKMDWWMFVLYVLIIVALLSLKVFGYLATVLTKPLSFLSKNDSITKTFSSFVFILVGVTSAKIPWRYSLEYDPLQYVIAVTLTLKAIVFFGYFLLFLFVSWKKERNNEPFWKSEFKTKRKPAKIVYSQTALDKILKDETGTPIFEIADAEIAWNALVEITKGNHNIAYKVAENMLSKKKEALKNVKEAKLQGNTVSEMIQSENARLVAIEVAQKEVDAWSKIIAEGKRRQIKEKYFVQ